MTAFDHEFVHVLQELAPLRSGHSPEFKGLAKRIFGHDYRVERLDRPAGRVRIG